MEPASDARSVPASWVRSTGEPFGAWGGDYQRSCTWARMRSSYTRSRSASWESDSGAIEAAATLPRTWVDVAGAGDHRGDAGLVDHPAQRERRGRDGVTGDLGDLAGRRDAHLERDAGEGLPHVERLAVPVEVPVVVGRERRSTRRTCR